MAITIADITFEYHVYDERGDTLFLGVKGPSYRLPDDTYDTPEGHFVELDEQGSLVAIEFMCPRRLLERDGHLTLTLEDRPAVDCTSDLAPLLAQRSAALGR
jgi:uncharacterized protein YuzE